VTIPTWVPVIERPPAPGRGGHAVGQSDLLAGGQQHVELPAGVDRHGWRAPGAGELIGGVAHRRERQSAGVTPARGLAAIAGHGLDSLDGEGGRLPNSDQQGHPGLRARVVRAAYSGAAGNTHRGSASPGLAPASASLISQHHWPSRARKAGGGPRIVCASRRSVSGCRCRGGRRDHKPRPAPLGLPAASPRAPAGLAGARATIRRGGAPRPSPKVIGRAIASPIGRAAGHRQFAGWFVAWLPPEPPRRRHQSAAGSNRRASFSARWRGGTVTAIALSRAPTLGGEGHGRRPGPCAAPGQLASPSRRAGRAKLWLLGHGPQALGGAQRASGLPRALTAPDGCASGIQPQRFPPGGQPDRQGRRCKKGCAGGQHHHLRLTATRARARSLRAAPPGPLVA